MGIELTFRPILMEFSGDERDKWTVGDRSDCIDRYCAGISGGQGIGGFGEFIVGKHWQQRGYRWVHHDYDIFGDNMDGKYPESQKILEDALGDRLAKFKVLCNTLGPFRENGHAPVAQPDLLIYKPETMEIRFAECKRHGTPDRVNSRQALGLFLIASMLRLPVDVFVVAEAGICSKPLEPVTFVYDEGGVKPSG